MAFAWVFVVALAMVAVGVVDARAQVLPGVDAVIYAVTYVEVMPTSRAYCSSSANSSNLGDTFVCLSYR